MSKIRISLTVIMVGLAAVLLSTIGTLISKMNFQIHQNSFIDSLGKYQLFALTIGLFYAGLSLLINPKSRVFLSIGTVTSIAEKERWLGIDGKSTWLKNGLQLLFSISLLTGIFMFLGLKYTNTLNNFQFWYLPYILIFSLTNSFVEEIIFRFGVIAMLHNHYPKITISIVSAILFGVPHYFGNPSGIMGVMMSGALGYILCKATIETKGISIAWIIHFIQDVIIFTAILMMNIKE